MTTPKAKAKRKPKPVVRTVRSVAVLIRWRRGDYSIEPFHSIEWAKEWAAKTGCKILDTMPVIFRFEEPTP